MNKKVFSIIFIMISAVFIICIPSSKVMAATSNDGNWVYNKLSDSNGNYAIITKYTGNINVTSIVIPNNIDGIPVKSIEGYTDNNGNWFSPFNGCNSLSSITISNGVTSIGDTAFYWCSNLSSITIPNSVTSIGNNAFGCCLGLSSMTIPNSVTSIGDFVFDGCSNLSSMTIPNSVTSIGNLAFASCLDLSSITIANGLATIGDYAFTGTKSNLSITTYQEDPNANSNVKTYAHNNGIRCNPTTPPFEEATLEASVALASATSLTPQVGDNNAITLTVKDSAGNVDTTFSGIETVTISGVKPAPDGSYGTIDSQKLDYDSSSTTGQAIQLAFNKGQATCDLALNDAENQSIEFSAAGVSEPNANILNINPINRDAYSIEVITQPVPGAVSGDTFLVQPAAALIDKYGNICSTGASASASITASAEASTGSFSLGGPVAESAQGGKVTFTDLTCLCQSAGDGAITFSSGNMTKDSSKFTIPPKKPAVELTPDTTNDDVDHNIEITFTPDSDFESSITGVSFNGNTLTTNQYKVESGKIILYPSVTDNKYLSTPASGEIVIKAANYNDSTVQQTIFGVSSINPSTVNFDKYTSSTNYKDIPVTMNLNGNVLNSIKNGTSQLTAGTDYSVSGDTVTISKAYLAKQLIGNTTLTFNFSAGNAQTLTVAVGDTTPQGASFTVKFIGANGSESVNINNLVINSNGSNQYQFKLPNGVKDNIVKAINDTNPSSVVISSGSKSITVTFSQILSMNDANLENGITLPISIGTNSKINSGQYTSVLSMTLGSTDSNFDLMFTAINNSSIAPSTVNFDKYTGSTNYKDIPVTMNLNGNTLSSIKNGTSALTAGTDYSVSGNIVTISKMYLAKQSVGTTSLTFNFNAGNTQTLTVSVADTTPYIPTPVEETIPVSVEVGNGQQNVISINAVRAEDTDGLEKETLNLDETTAKEIVEIASKNKLSEVSIILPSSTEYSKDKIDMQFSKEFLAELADSNISLNIENGETYLRLSAQTIADLKDKNQEIDFNKAVETGEINSLISQLGLEGQAVGEPISINNSFTDREKINISVDASKFSSKDDLEKYLSSLFVLEENNDGKIVVDKGTIQYDSKGNPTGISVWVSGSEYFSLVQLNESYFNGITTIMPDKVSANKEWNIKFTEPANPASITKDNVYVTDLKGNKVAANVSYGSDNTLKVSPVNAFVSGETYYLYITKNVTSKDGLPLGSETRVQFNVI